MNGQRVSRNRDKTTRDDYRGITVDHGMAVDRSGTAVGDEMAVHWRETAVGLMIKILLIIGLK
jgi:hypothetical protein